MESYGILFNSCYYYYVHVSCFFIILLSRVKLTKSNRVAITNTLALFHLIINLATFLKISHLNIDIIASVKSGGKINEKTMLESYRLDALIS